MLGPPLHAPQSVSSPTLVLLPQDSSPLGQRLPAEEHAQLWGTGQAQKPSTASKQGRAPLLAFTAAGAHQQPIAPPDARTTQPQATLHEVPNLALLVLLHSFGATVLMPGGKKEHTLNINRTKLDLPLTASAPTSLGPDITHDRAVLATDE